MTACHLQLLLHFPLSPQSRRSSPKTLGSSSTPWRPSRKNQTTHTITTTTTLHKTLLVNNGTYNQLIHKQCTTPVNRASVDVRRRQQYIARHLNKRICTHLEPQSNFATVVQSSNPRIHGGILRECKINKPGNASGGEAYTSECRENESTPCREGVPATAGAKHTNKTAALAP